MNEWMDVDGWTFHGSLFLLPSICYIRAAIAVKLSTGIDGLVCRRRI
jgi:hypothetical protein